MFKMTIAVNKNLILITGLLFLYLIASLIFLNGFFIWHYNCFIAIALLPFLFTIENKRFSYRYIIPAFIFGCLSIIVLSKTLLFLAITFGLILLIENIIGRLNHLLLFALIIISPIFGYLSIALGFPIRLFLSEWAVMLLNASGGNYTNSGNLILFNNFEFSIDQACAGLNMLATSLLICLFFIAYQAKKISHKSSLIKTVFLLAITVLLNVISNLFRIMLLVKWQILPDNIFHDVIGVLCLLFYVILPLYFLSASVIKFNGNKKFFIEKPKIHLLNKPILHISLLILIFIAGGLIYGKQTKYRDEQSTNLAGFSHEILSNGVSKFENDKALIYKKPTPFYAPEHNPMVCWVGSGYDFKMIRKEKFKNREIYTGFLVKGNDKIYTAWWFESKTLQTINQIEWRWISLINNENFYLINVNASTSQQLKILVDNMLNNKI